MKLCIGDMWEQWDEPNALFVVTCCSIVRSDGALTMGRGIAKAMRDKIPDLAPRVGQIISLRPDGDRYGLLVIDMHGHRIGLFQVKEHFKDRADLDLIKMSASRLCAWCERHPDVAVNLNFPGIGHGHRSEEEVLPLLETLPDQVNVWKFK